MKNGKRPTMAQKLRMKSLGIDPKVWLVSKCTPTEFVVVHPVSREIRTLEMSTKQ